MLSPLLANSISLKAIAELKDKAFFVPPYQRGYRWTPQQVTELLDDLNGFHAKDATSFYCLQPVLVKRRQDDKWELIDGQQRLTTIYLLLDYLEGAKEADYKPLFSLEYATRHDSADYLQNLTAERADANIDYYHFNRSLTCIKAWFAKQPVRRSAISKLSLVLLEQTKVIWYELNPDTNEEQDAFIRINSGKIPLTNAELIRALFLKRIPQATELAQQQFERQQRELATEWDAIEAQLQQDDLWYFLNPRPNPQPARIEYLFDLLASTEADKGQLATFHYFDRKLAKATTDDLLAYWRKVKSLFLRLEQWYNDWDLYHWIGYLITVEVPARELVAQADALPKNAFRTYLQQCISQQVQGTMEEWTYTDNRHELQRVLLLLNVETLRSNKAAGYRFPFRQYKGGGKGGVVWSLEHINAQNPQGLTSKQAYREWLNAAEEFVEAQEQDNSQLAEADRETGGETAAQVKQVLAELLQQSDISKEAFGEMQLRILRLFGEPDLDTIDNLALLAGRDNSALGNGTFPQKRRKIIALEKQGSFIPIATRNVFLKYYSVAAAHLNYWGEADRQAYVAAIRSTLQEYLTPLSAATDGN